MRTEGVEVDWENPDTFKSPSVSEELFRKLSHSIAHGGNYGGVVMGWDQDFSYYKLCKSVKKRN